MPYHHVSVTRPTTKAEAKVFDHASAMLADVYTMCSGHQLKRTKGGGCNFSAALVLVCVLDALAGHIYAPTMAIKSRTKARGVQQLRFEKLIVDLMPWHPSWAPTKQDFAEILYVEIRNPLTHEVGRDPSFVKARPPGFTEPEVNVWSAVKPRRIGVVDARKTWPEKWPILEPDPRLLSSATGKPTRYRLTVVALYWAVKDILGQLAK